MLYRAIPYPYLPYHTTTIPAAVPAIRSLAVPIIPVLAILSGGAALLPFLALLLSALPLLLPLLLALFLTLRLLSGLLRSLALAPLGFLPLLRALLAGVSQPAAEAPGLLRVRIM